MAADDTLVITVIVVARLTLPLVIPRMPEPLPGWRFTVPPVPVMPMRRAGRVLSDRGNLPVATGLFFAYLATLIVVLYDAYRPVRTTRDELLRAVTQKSAVSA
jgi:hypothetical protein